MKLVFVVKPWAKCHWTNRMQVISFALNKSYVELRAHGPAKHSHTQHTHTHTLSHTHEHQKIQIAHKFFIHTYYTVHTVHTVHTYIHTYKHTYIHTCMQTSAYIHTYSTCLYYRRYYLVFSNRSLAFWALFHQTVQIEELMLHLPNSSIWNFLYYGKSVLEHFTGSNCTKKQYVE